MNLDSHTPQGVDKVVRYGWVQTDKPGDLRWLHKDQLAVDPLYQRAVTPTKVKEITAAWSWPALGCIIVGERDGKLFVIDGGHRTAAAKRRSDISLLPCVVFPMKSAREEAEAFLKVNKGRKPMNAIDTHRAKLGAEDEGAIFVMGLCSRVGLTLQRSAETVGQIACVKWLTDKARDDRDSLARVLALTSEMCARDGLPVPQKLLDGIWYLHKKCGEGLNDERLTSRIRDKGAMVLYAGAIRESATHLRGGAATYARGMLEVLNKGLRKPFVLGTQTL